MKKILGFSLAEALVTLLIVCIIAIMTAPMITKKKRKDPMQVLWNVDTKIENVIYPNAKRDIMLGEITKNNTQGIVIVGTMYFKDRNGNKIGWISEDGSSSFAQASSSGSSQGDSGSNIDYEAMMENQKKVMEMLNMLQGMMKKGPSASNSESEKMLQDQLNNLINSMNQNTYGK